jgi:hypothetical protein
MPKRALPASSPASMPTQPRARSRRAPTKRAFAHAPGSRPQSGGVVINARGGPTITMPIGPALQEAALEWSRIVRNRLRWAAQVEGRVDQARHSRALLDSLGVNLGAVDQFAEASVIQVSIPFEQEEVGWEARIFPWEYVLSAAIRGTRTKPLMIVRHLDRGAAGGESARPVKSTPDPTLIVENAPGTLRNRFQFDSERKLVASSLRHVEVQVLPDASPSQAREHIVARAPGAIHLSGFDTHQGAQLLGREDGGIDGFLMVDARGLPRDVPAAELAGLLTSAATMPRLVACNFQNSAARVAAMVVAQGAEASIGFQDVVEDNLAELLFATFYANWDDRNWATFDAFESTFLDLQSRPVSMSGSGIVLWLAHDVFAGASAVGVVAQAPVVEVLSRADDPRPTVDAEDRPAPGGQLGVLPQPGAPGGASIPPLLKPGVASIVAPPPDMWVDARVVRRVNYSRLHNDRSLFDSFTIGKGIAEDIPNVHVEVILYVGSDSFPYRMSLSLKDRSTDLTQRIRVPLTSSLLRGTRESVQSVVYVGVKRGTETVFQDTFAVSLIPIEEWASDDQDAMWLPSFVLPRDPAVAQIVERALGPLRALDDRARVGFMGYQVVDETDNDPYDRVDLQVKAIWSTLSFQYDIAYINPPPTYSPRAQRLRTPTEILRSKAGTCIDLALLFAACLELIDIYPVIVLYSGHANVGYFRGDKLHQAFELLQKPVSRAVVGAASAGGGTGTAVDVGAANGGANGQAQGVPDTETRDTPLVPWQVRRQSDQSDPALRELMARVERNELLILDATRMTFRDGFDEALELGKRSLDSADPGAGRVFLSLIDIQIARRNGITPLPMESR